MQNRLVIIITILGTIIVKIVVSMIWYSKHCKATDKVRHFSCNSEGTVRPFNQLLHTLNRQDIDISSPKLMYTMASIKDKTHLGRGTPIPKEKPLVGQSNKQVN